MRKRIIIPATVILLATIMAAEQSLAMGYGPSQSSLIRRFRGVSPEKSIEEYQQQQLIQDGLHLQLEQAVLSQQIDQQTMDDIVDKHAEIMLTHQEILNDIDYNQADAYIYKAAMHDELNSWADEAEIDLHFFQPQFIDNLWQSVN